MSGRRIRSAPQTRHGGNVGRKKRQEMETDSSDDDSEVEMLRQLAGLDISEGKPETNHGTGYIYDTLMLKHKCEWDPEYPESPERLSKSHGRCQELGLIDRCKQIEINYATEDEIMEKHSRDHVELAKSTASMRPKERMAFCEKYDSWYANKDTFETALISCGSTIRLLEHILRDEITNGFAMVRPPGHHAMEDEFNGYCMFNNVAIAANSALKMGLQRILIVDWDVHHGQGTQRMFYDDPRVLYFSIHRYEFGHYWPNLRESDYDFIGSKEGEGYNVNVPLNQIGMGNSDYMAILHQLLLPIAYEFVPQLILVSHGLDSAMGDEKGEMMLTPAMYAHMTHHLSALASGRVAVVLEGGYCLNSLAEGCALTLRSLLGDPCPQIQATEEPCDSIVTTILNAIKVLQPFWICFDHYGKVYGETKCPFEGVNSVPPLENVEFSTVCNRPPKFELQGCFPTQSAEVIDEFTRLLDELKASTSLRVASSKCCFVFDAEMRAHKNMFHKSHPERPDRISSIYNLLNAWGLASRCLNVPSRLARKSELLWIHTESYLEDITQTQRMTEDELESFPNRKCYPSIFLNQKSVHCALLSCGSVLNAVEAVLTNQAQSGVAIVRPPGHHAECHKAMGFCLFNNVAVAAKFAQNKFGLKRILILDWDVHHGNATQHQFYNDPSVLYISLHRYDNGFFFPGSHDADLDHVGAGPGRGFNVNIPWSSARMGDSEYLTAFTQIVMPIAYQFAPELVLVSAGFDAAIGDPLGGFKITPAGFGHMTHMLKGLANGRLILALEGGYNLNSISLSMAVCTSVLLGDPCPALASLEPCARAMDTINAVLMVQKEYWSCLKCKVCIPAPLHSRHHDGRPDSARMGDRSPRLKTAWSSPPVKMQYSTEASPPTSVYHSCSSPSSSSISSISTSDSTGVKTTAEATPPGRGVGANAERSASAQPASSPARSVPLKTEALCARDGGDFGGRAESKAVAPDRKQLPVFKSTVYSGVPSPDDDDNMSIFVALPNSDVTATETETATAKGQDADHPTCKDEQREHKGECPDVARSQGHGSPPTEQPMETRTSQGDGGVKEVKEQIPADGNQSNDEEVGRTGTANHPITDDGAEGVAEATSHPDDEGAVGGACSSSTANRPATVQDFLRMEGASQMYAVQPLLWCPHLKEVKPLPSAPINVHDPCSTCGDQSENWICLTCYQVECSRFVQEHMLYHKLETDHNMCLSYSDLSVWCYCCDQYVDNRILQPMKSAAHLSKFGESL